MLEEVSMDKKTLNRPVQTPGKGNGTELKKQDAPPSGKQIPRSCRKREPASSSNGFKFDQNRKPAPQKSKAIDKRPQSRGYYNSSGKENTQVKIGQDEVEFGSLYFGGRKKQSLNHLLNFHYEPRGEAVQAGRQPLKRNFSSTKALMATQAHKYNKEQFLQANCQFIVRFGEDYSPYMSDPDILVDWDLIEMIRVWSNEKVVCPICLYPPVAGKITRCGHVYCWSCILHYLALSDKTWRKCPICYEAIHKNDLKSVQCIENTIWSVGKSITLQLMKREKGSLVASPVTQHDLRSTKSLLHLSEENLDTVYSKLILADQNDIMNILEKEKNGLTSQLEECKDCPELCFVEQAIELLHERKLKMEEKQVEIKKETEAMVDKSMKTPLVDSVEHSCAMMLPVDMLSPEMGEDSDILHSRQRYESLSSEGEDNANVSAEDLYIGTNQNNNQPVKYFYFYQAKDGQQIYLHAIDVKMLEKNYGSLEHCPPTITGSILEKESGSMTQELRKRLRYMQHIPITCQFEVVEISLSPPLITPEVLNSFQDQLEQRKYNRAKRARQERRREKKIEVQIFGLPEAPNLKIESLHHFPQCGVDNPPPSSSPQVESLESSRASSPTSMKPTASSISCAMAALAIEDHGSVSPSEDSGPSFAQMLREGKTVRPSGGGWPAIVDGKVWGTQPQRQRQSSLAESDSEMGSAFSPPAKHSFNIAEALQNASLNKQGSLECSAGKKKKRKQKILFSTGMACTGK